MRIYSTDRLKHLRIVVTGGGTGGHTYPALTTIRGLRRRLNDAGAEPEVLWVGVAHGLEAKIAREQGIPFRALTTGKLRRSPKGRELIQNFVDAFRIPIGLVQAVLTVMRTKPQVVFSTGGYVSVPIGVAAWLLRRPYVMHEQILTLGLANRILARFASRILLSQESSLPLLPERIRARAVVTGNPIRPEVMAGDAQRGRERFGLSPNLPTVLVTGGAQGAVQVNTLVSQVLVDILPYAQVIHQSGAHSIHRMRELAQSLPPGLKERYHLVEYLHEELPDVLASADLCVGRSGAGTVAELTALGKPCIFIPLIPTGGDEQRRTAQHLTEMNAARMLAGPDATPDRLRDEILTLLKDPAQLAAMAEASRRQGRPDAVERVVTELIQAAK